MQASSNIPHKIHVEIVRVVHKAVHTKNNHETQQYTS